MRGEFMETNQRRQRSTIKQNTQNKKISKRSVNRRAKKNKNNYMKAHRKKFSFRKSLSRSTGFYLDYSLMLIMIILIGIGLVMVYSSSSTTTDSLKGVLKSQVIFAVFGLLMMMIVARVLDYHILTNKYVARGLYIFSLILVLLLLTPLGKNYNGATRWIVIGGFNFMPVEFVKVGIIAALACRMSSLGEKMKYFRVVVWLIAWYGVVPAAMLYFISNNLSSAIIILGMAFLITFVAYPGYKPYIAMFAGATAFISVAFSAILSAIQKGDGFRSTRILAWLHPEDYADGEAYQTIHGLYAIGSGGLFGKGLGKSVVKLKLPEAYNDMIFTIICEELGLFGALCVLIAFGVLLWRIAHVARNAPDMQGALLCAGVFSHIALQVLVNIAVVTDTIPNTGVTLPFISKGGTALLILLLEMGVVFNVSSQIKDELNE